MKTADLIPKAVYLSRWFPTTGESVPGFCCAARIFIVPRQIQAPGLAAYRIVPNGFCCANWAGPRLKNPSWLSDLQPSAPLAGYVMEHGEFSASIPKDSRITKGLKVTIEMTDFS
jgi:hypothetical protein